MDIGTILLFLSGLALLVIGAEFLVKGSSRLAVAAGISPLVVGLTVVAFGTSSPELAVSLKSAWMGQADIAVGNVVGSNIFNVLFILGISALIVPLSISQQLVRIDTPIMIAVSLLVLGFAWNGSLNRLEGVILFIGIIIYILLAIYMSRRESKEVKEEYEHEYAPKQIMSPGRIIQSILLVVVGLVLLVWGARWLVDSAVNMARAFGLSELVVGLTLIAAGTSMPEVATSIIASLRGEKDIAVGNVVGSNIFNIFAVLGLTCVFAPSDVNVTAEALRFDIPVMIAVAIACLPVFFTGGVIARWEGAVFLVYYVAYTAFLILDASDHESKGAFTIAMVWFVIPLTLITLMVSIGRTLKRA